MERGELRFCQPLFLYSRSRNLSHICFRMELFPKGGLEIEEQLARALSIYFNFPQPKNLMVFMG